MGRFGSSGVRVGWLLVLLGWLATGCAGSLDMGSLDTGSLDPGFPERSITTLRVASLNLAHARGGAVAVATDEAGARANLESLAEAIRSVDADVVCLQELDRRCAWSGGFDHLHVLLELTGFEHSARHCFVDNGLLSYGVGILSRHPIAESTGGTLASSPVSPPKGYVTARLDLPDPVYVTSVHLDFLSGDARARQCEALADHVAALGGSTILAGDFNVEWGGDSPLPCLCERAGLVPVAPEDSRPTHRLTSARIDWIFASSRGVASDYRAIDVAPSDHRLIVAEVEISPRVLRESDRTAPRTTP